MILPDYPIDKKEQDQLKRYPLASKVAAMISAFEGKESFVIGVEGKWGSGKTSFVNLVLEQISPNDIVHFIFNPWNFSDEASLLRDFFIKFSDAVEKITGRETGKRMKEYAGKLSDIDLGISYHGLSFNPLKLLKFWSPDTSLEAIRKELDGALAGIPKKIVVVIDDIDRLDKKETKLILKLVKLTADFPKTIFILAYDRDRVEDRITEKENGLDGGEYLKKIIQVSFSLPMPDQQELWNILFKDLDLTLQEVYKVKEVLEEGKEQREWNKLFTSGFGDLFETIRDIKRYISSLRLDWSIMGRSDVNKVDFLGIEAVRVFAPKFYDAIPANKDLFIESTDMFGRLNYGQNAEQVRRDKYNGLLTTLITDEKIRKHIDKVCKELFPQIGTGGTPISEQWERELKICHPDRFKFYFQLGIPHGEISESQVDAFIAALSSADTFSELILQYKEDKKLRKILTKLVRRHDTLNEAQIEMAISVLWSLEKDIDEEKEAVFDLDDIGTQVMRFGYNALKIVPTENRRALLEKIYNSATHLYYPLHLLHVFEDRATRHPGEVNIDDDTFASLKGIMVEKIKTAVTNSTLKDEEHQVAILYRWLAWESPEAVANYISEAISTRKGFMTFLQSFVGTTLSSAGNYNELNRNSISGLYPIAEIESLVNAITEEELAQMTDKEKEAINLFKNPSRDW